MRRARRDSVHGKASTPSYFSAQLLTSSQPAAARLTLHDTRASLNAIARAAGTPACSEASSAGAPNPQRPPTRRAARFAAVTHASLSASALSRPRARKAHAHASAMSAVALWKGAVSESCSAPVRKSTRDLGVERCEKRSWATCSHQESIRKCPNAKPQDAPLRPVTPVAWHAPGCHNRPPWCSRPSTRYKKAQQKPKSDDTQQKTESCPS